MKKKIMNDYVCMRRGLSKVHTSSKHKTLNATQETMKKSGKKEGEISTMPIVNKGNNIKHQQQHRDNTTCLLQLRQHCPRQQHFKWKCLISHNRISILEQGKESETKKNCASTFQLFQRKSFYFVLQFWIVRDCGIMHNIWSCSYWFLFTKHPSWETHGYNLATLNSVKDNNVMGQSA